MIIKNQNILSGLQTLGLTNKEAEVYYILATEGPLTAEKISKRVKVYYPAIYRTLESLLNKGWIESSSDRPKLYRAKSIEIAAEHAASKLISEINTATENLIKIFQSIPIYKKNKHENGLWIFRGWKNTLNKINEISKISKRSIYVVIKEYINYSELKEILDIISKSDAFSNVYLTTDLDLSNLFDAYPTINFQINKSKFRRDSTRFVLIIIIFDEKQAILINAYYRNEIMEKDKVYATWERDPNLIEILLEGNGLKLKDWWV